TIRGCPADAVRGRCCLRSLVMAMWTRLVFALLVMSWGLTANAQAPTPEDADRFKATLVRLNALLDGLDAKQRERAPFVDAAVCVKAAEWILRHNEFYRPQYVKSVDKVLEMAFVRTQGIVQGKTDWDKSSGGHGLGYRSKVDGSLQPYALTLPRNFDAGASG